MKVFCFMLIGELPHSIRLVNWYMKTLEYSHQINKYHLRGLSWYCYNEYSEGKNVMLTLFVRCK